MQALTPLYHLHLCQHVHRDLREEIFRYFEQEFLRNFFSTSPSRSFVMATLTSFGV